MKKLGFGFAVFAAFAAFVMITSCELFEKQEVLPSLEGTLIITFSGQGTPTQTTANVKEWEVTTNTLLTATYQKPSDEEAAELEYKWYKVTIAGGEIIPLPPKTPVATENTYTVTTTGSYTVEVNYKDEKLGKVPLSTTNVVTRK